jgi:hypothetical protein
MIDTSRELGILFTIVATFLSTVVAYFLINPPINSNIQPMLVLAFLLAIFSTVAATVNLMKEKRV